MNTLLAINAILGTIFCAFCAYYGRVTYLVARGAPETVAGAHWEWVRTIGGLVRSHWLIGVLGVVGVGLLGSSWGMYEWPKSVPRPITKTIVKSVPTSDPAQAAQIVSLSLQLAAAEQKIKQLEGSRAPPPKISTPSQPPVYQSGSGNALSIGQQGGITAATINVGKPDRVLNDAIRARLIDMMHGLPTAPKEVVVIATNDAEAISYAKEIAAYLHAEGLNAQFGGSGEFFPPFPSGVQVSPTPDKDGVEDIHVGPK